MKSSEPACTQPRPSGQLSGTGEHRINILLQHFDPSAGPIVANGPWKPVGATSTTSYPPHTIVDVWISKR